VRFMIVILYSSSFCESQLSPSPFGLALSENPIGECVVSHSKHAKEVELDYTLHFSRKQEMNTEFILEKCVQCNLEKSRCM
jgi:hypothetical protein